MRELGAAGGTWPALFQLPHLYTGGSHAHPSGRTGCCLAQHAHPGALAAGALAAAGYVCRFPGKPRVHTPTARQHASRGSVGCAASNPRRVSSYRCSNPRTRVISQFRRSEVRNASHGAHIKVQAGLPSLWTLPGRIAFFACSSF